MRLSEWCTRDLITRRESSVRVFLHMGRIKVSMDALMELRDGIIGLKRDREAETSIEEGGKK
jgi:hypothetical protein